MPPAETRTPPLAEVERHFLKAMIQGGAFGRSQGPFPEIEHPLLRALAPLIPEKRAVDVGGYQGAYTDLFLAAGFEVTVCEPVPTLMRNLRARFSGNEGVTFVRAAISSNTGAAALKLARKGAVPGVDDDPNLFNSLVEHETQGFIDLSENLQVPVRTVRDLVETGLVRAPIGILKIDTEGQDRSVLEGAWPHWGRVTLCEYWSDTHAWGGPSTANEPLHYREYLRHFEGYRLLVLGRDDARRRLFFQLDPGTTVPGSWGNVLITRDEVVLAAAVEWCLDVMGPDGIEI